jgi:3'-phosphoadenosine 5'-phosphosulfate sulfotransferase
MRKMMTKEVTKTNVSIAKMEMKDGLPVATQLDDEILLGNVSEEKAQKIISKKLGEQVTVFKTSTDTEVYEMPVDEFIKYATIKVETESPEQAEPIKFESETPKQA